MARGHLRPSVRRIRVTELAQRRTPPLLPCV